MSTHARGPSFAATQDGKREGLVVWDQQGLVVVWPDGHSSRFSWTALRQGCPCPECHPHQTPDEGEVKGFSAASVPSAPGPLWQEH